MGLELDHFPFALNGRLVRICSEIRDGRRRAQHRDDVQLLLKIGLVELRLGQIEVSLLGRTDTLLSCPDALFRARNWPGWTDLVS